MKEKILTVGIDPGAKGAIGIYNKKTKQIDGTFELPKKSGGRKSVEVDGLSVYNLLHQFADIISCVCIESPLYKLGEDGAAVVCERFENFGIIRGAVEVLKVKHFCAVPSVWKKRTGLSSDKNESISLAISMFPEQKHLFPAHKFHDIAEACLLAHYAFLHEDEYGFFGALTPIERTLKPKNQSKLTDDMVKEIERLCREDGFTDKQLAIKYKVSTSVISNILQGRTWKHLGFKS